MKELKETMKNEKIDLKIDLKMDQRNLSLYYIYKKYIEINSDYRS